MKYDIERAAVTMSVTELCALALLGGDLDLRPGMTKRFSAERAQIGAKVHRKLQAEAGAQYDAEVALTNTTLYHNLAFEVSGRADGVLRTDPLTVDEIKTVSARAFDLPPAPMHDAQVKCYAYFLCREKELAGIHTRLTYYCTEDGRTRYLTTYHNAKDLQTFYFGLLSRVEYRARILIERQTVLLPSVHEGRFPYASVREGQDVMLRECYRDIRAGKRLFVEAPTGTGKTLSALYPAVRALGEGHCDKIFYLTAKASTRREAFRAAEQIFRAGSHMRTVVLTAREQICQNEQAKCDPAGISRHCNPYDCPYAKGFYDRCGSAVCDALEKQNGFPRNAVLEIARRFGICPYEFQLELSMFCDIVICDYNYAFDPQVYLRRYFEPEAVAENRYVFLIDEAHNLGDRTCSMYSAELQMSDVTSLWRALPESEAALRNALEKLAVTMHGFRRLCRDTLQKDEHGVERGYSLLRNPMESFHELVTQTRAALEKWLRTHYGDALEPAVHTCASKFKRFELIAESYDERFLTFLEVEGDRRTVRLICLDPSNILECALSRAKASVLFSATLTPTDYFADILGGGKDPVCISLPSPFDPRNCCVVAVPSVSTRFEDRASTYKKIAAYIAATVSAQKGNYIAYFPSYQYMEAVHKAFTEKYTQIPTVVQTRGMSAAARETFLNAFVEDRTWRVGFCVLGGSFSEGVDLPGKKLIGAIVVGTGIPAISNERNILREYYETTRESGYEYAYTYPGMNRVLQAAGRVIRREDDRGVIVLIDERYESPRYRPLLPEHWEHLQYARNPNELAKITADFWANPEK